MYDSWPPEVELLGFVERALIIAENRHRVVKRHPPGSEENDAYGSTLELVEAAAIRLRLMLVNQPGGRRSAWSLITVEDLVRLLDRWIQDPAHRTEDPGLTHLLSRQASAWRVSLEGGDPGLESDLYTVLAHQAVLRERGGLTSSERAMCDAAVARISRRQGGLRWLIRRDQLRAYAEMIVRGAENHPESESATGRAALDRVLEHEVPLKVYLAFDQFDLELKGVSPTSERFDKLGDRVYKHLFNTINPQLLDDLTNRDWRRKKAREGKILVFSELTTSDDSGADDPPHFEPPVLDAPDATWPVLSELARMKLTQSLLREAVQLGYITLAERSVIRRRLREESYAQIARSEPGVKRNTLEKRFSRAVEGLCRYSEEHSA
jgi:hypothetical protein